MISLVEITGDQDLPKASSGHGCINMVCATKFVTRAKDYGSSQPNLGKEPPPTESPLCIENPIDNSQATQNYFVVEDLATLLVRCLHSKYFRFVLHKGRICFLLLGLTMITLPLSSNLKPRDYNLACLTTCLS